MGILSTLALSAMLAAAPAQGWAGSTPPGFDSVKWQQLIARAIEKGNRMELPDGIYSSLGQTVPSDPEQDHHSEYFSTVGELSQNHYFPLWVETVSEDWERNAKGNWAIDQWQYRVSVQGEVDRVVHLHIVEEKDGNVLSSDYLPTGGPGDALVLKRFEQTLNQWWY